MRLHCFCLLVAFYCVAARGAPVASLVTVTESGEIRPEGAVGGISNLAYAAGTAAAAAQRVVALDDTATLLSNRLLSVVGLLAAREGVGYVRGHVIEFSGAGIDPSSVTSTIVKLSLGANDGTNQIVDTWTWYSVDPGYAPGIKFGSSLSTTNAWGNASIVDSGTTNIAVGSTVYETWHVAAAIPAALSNVVLQAFAEVGGVGTNDAVLAVEGGISPGGLAPLTKDFYDAESNLVMRIVGGLAVEIN